MAEGAAEDEPVREAHGVHQLGHLPEPDSLKIGQGSVAAPVVQGYSSDLRLLFVDKGLW